MKSKNYKKWDVHHHIVPDFYAEEMKKMGMKDFNTIKWPNWNPEFSLKMMGTFNIEKAFVSISAPGVYFKDVEYSKSLSRRCNEYIGRMVRDYPERFGGFASVPLPDVKSALEELVYAMDTLKLDGVGLLSNVDGRYLGDVAYRDFFAELDRRNAVVYIHPNGILKRENHQFLNPLYLWQNDTTRTIIDFVKSGYHRDYPNIKWILSHGGGILAPLYNTLVATLKDENPTIESELKVWKSQLFIDTASKAFDEQIPFLLGFSDEKHVLFGSDIGWANKMAVSTVVKSYSGLDEKFGLTPDRIEDIFMGNAKRLFTQDKIPVSQEAPINIKETKASKEALDSDSIAYHCHCIPERVLEKIRSDYQELEIEGIEPFNEERTLSWMRENEYKKVLLSFDLPPLWKMNRKDIAAILRLYNEEAAKIRDRNLQSFEAFGAVDIDQPLFTTEEINHCINDLKMDGIALYTRMNETKFDEFMDERILEKLSGIDVPVMIHPQDSSGDPLINDNYLDAVYFMAKAFYLGSYSKYLSNVKFMLMHTGGILPYVSQPLNILFYMTIKKPRVWLYLMDNMIRKN
ncbi:MAG: amidohydrolase 2, partial [Clostridia bacterium]|nr:amidohydrolase 2 [Clostridia bacterium]